MGEVARRYTVLELVECLRLMTECFC